MKQETEMYCSYKSVCVNFVYVCVYWEIILELHLQIFTLYFACLTAPLMPALLFVINK